MLRNGWYTENYAGSISCALAAGVVLGSAGDGKIASATRADYAEAAVAVLTTEGHQGKIYELAGDNAWTLTDLATEISRHSGKLIPYKNLGEGEYARSTQKSFGFPDEIAQVLAGMDVAVSKDALFDNGHQLSKLIGRSTTPMPVTVAEAVEETT